MTQKNFSVDDYSGRNKGIGGSDAGAVLGVNPYRSAKAVWQEKVGIKKPASLSHLKKIQWGNKLEPTIVQFYSESTGYKVITEDVTHYHPEHEFMFAHVDGFVPEKNRVLEIKTSSNEKMWADGVPDYYKAQCLHYCTVLGVTDADLAVLINGHDFRVYKLKFTQEDIDNLIAKEKFFWDRVQSNYWPEGKPARKKKVRVGGSSEVMDLCVKIKNIASKLKILNAEKSALEDTLKEELGEDDSIVDDGGNEIASYRIQNRSQFDSRRFKKSISALYENEETNEKIIEWLESNEFYTDKEIKILKIK